MLGKTRENLGVLDVLNSDMNGNVVFASDVVLTAGTKCRDMKMCFLTY